MRKSAWSFAGKVVAAGLLAGLADFLFYGGEGGGGGSTVGAFALVWAALLLLIVRPVRRRRGALVAAGAALLFGALLADNPGPLGWILFWTSVSTAALLTRRRFDDALSWMLRLIVHVGYGAIRPFGDLRRVLRARTPGSRVSFGALLSIAAIPVAGGALFIALFATANPLIASFFSAVSVPSPFPMTLHLLLWAIVFLGVWPSLRPHPRAIDMAIGPVPLEGVLPNIPLASITLSLLTFNAIFAVQNALDIAFLWSGARLPGTITLADYAHGGVYTLIGTALLAGLFVLTVLRPGTESARRPAIRLLVALWIAQNLLLVASSILRLTDYVESYSLTELRIWAFGGMALVGIGLALVCWRLLRGKSTAWLINRNALAAGLALTLAAGVDAGQVAAEWNVRHAREVGGRGLELDLCYLRAQGPAALLPLIEFEQRMAAQPQLLDRVRAIRAEAMKALASRQADWRSWTSRNARRLAAAQARLGTNPAMPAPSPYGHACDGSPVPPPPPAEIPPDPTVNATQANTTAPATASEPAPLTQRPQ
jgi:hypothetical protein